MPLTPRTPRGKLSSRNVATPKSLKKKTILNFDPNLSYMEEDDYSYVVGESADEDSDDDSADELDDDEDADLLEEVKEEEENGDLEENGSVHKHQQQSTTAAERALFEDEDDSAKGSAEPEVQATTATSLDSRAGQSKLRQFLVKHEVLRKSLHLSIGVFTMWLYTLGVHQTQIIAPLVTLFGIIFTNDYIRLRNPELNQRICERWWFLIRESEVNLYNGTLYFLVGLVIVFSLFPKDISLMSVLLLSWADTAALTVGRAYGKYTPKISKGKSVAGSLASFATGVVSCYVLYGYFVPQYQHVNSVGDIMWTPETSKLNLHVYAVLSGLIASVSEFIDLGGLDDNFTIPVLSGGFLFAVVKMFSV